MMDTPPSRDDAESTLDIGVGPPEQTPRDRTKTLRRSCESCRASKARCIVEAVTPEQQRRCKRCVDHHPPARLRHLGGEWAFLKSLIGASTAEMNASLKIPLLGQGS